MNAYEFVITVLAFSPKYSKVAKNRESFDSRELYKTIMGCPEEFLKKIGIRHPIHGDSPALNEAFYDLSKNILNQLVRGGNYIWDFSETPRDYFDMHIKPKLEEGEFSEIEKIVNSID